MALEDAIAEYKIEGLVNGAIYSNYQRRRIENVCNELNIECLSPLWKLRPKDMLLEMLDNGFLIIMSAVAAGGLGPEWLGKELTPETVDELSELHETCYVCTGGEGGEFETFVTNCPLFKKKIKILENRKKWDSKTESGEFIIKKAKLE